MGKNESYYLKLFRSYIDGNISEEDVNELFSLIEERPWEAARMLEDEELTNLALMNVFKTEVSDSASLRMRERLIGSLPHLAGKECVWEDHPFLMENNRPVRRIPFSGSRWLKYAAAIILVVGSTVGFLLIPGEPHSDKKVTVSETKSVGNNIPPGSNKAKLTLSDGSVIVLDEAVNGTIINQGDVKVIKLANGEVLYDLSQNENNGKVLYNTMTTPKGGQYQLTLHDGTKVWLNSESSISFPTRFIGETRLVTMTGEMYFEVAKDDAKPFHVKTNNIDVAVLGTHFNINSYGNENFIKTTLLEGSVKVSLNSLSRSSLSSSSKNSGKLLQSVTLTPGQQARAAGMNKDSNYKSSEGHEKVNAEQQIRIIDDVNIEQAIAWKNGRFDFNGYDLPAVMRQLERWYDIQVRYVGEMPKDIFKGELPRDLALDQVLRILGKMEVNFRMEGRTLIVTK